MGHPQPPAPVNLFCGLLLAPAVDRDTVEQTLQRHFGPIVLRSQAFPFTQTAYYDREMGPGIRRQFVAFEPLIAMGELAAIKHTTNRLEVQWALPSGRRQVNLDPGYLSLGKVVLASTKDHAHRIYIGAEMYGEVTLRYAQKQFQPWPWTYPDYRLPPTLTFFEALRRHYKTRLRQHPLPASARPSSGTA